MYKEKGLVKAFNGKKYKIVTYQNKKGIITFATSNKSRKYAEITKRQKVKINFDGHVKKHPVTIFEDPTVVDQMFAGLKHDRVIPFFIPRKNKVIIQYRK